MGEVRPNLENAPLSDRNIHHKRCFETEKRDGSLSKKTAQQTSRYLLK